MPRILTAALALGLLAGCEATRYDPETVDSVEDRLPPLQPGMATTAEFVQGFDALEAGDYLTAEAMLRRSLDAQPNDPYALLAMGAVMERRGRDFEATTYYRSAARWGGEASLGRTIGVDVTTKRARTVRELALANAARIEGTRAPAL